MVKKDLPKIHVLSLHFHWCGRVGVLKKKCEIYFKIKIIL